MRELYEIKERLCDELKSYVNKDLTAGSLDIVDKLAHTIKNLNKVIEGEEGYSNGYSRTHRDSMGRYSRRNEGYGYRGDMM